jgi:hypothetical protein
MEKKGDMMFDDISNKTLALLIIVVLAISLGTTLMSLNLNTRLGTLLAARGGQGITGFSTASGTGIANVTINTLASIRFSINNIQFGIGSVNTTAGNQVCSLTTNHTLGTKDPGGMCINFTAVANLDSLEIENDGSVNLTVNVSFNKNASTFIGGGTSLLEHLRYYADNNETNSCSSPVPIGWTEVGVANAQIAICNTVQGLSFIQTRNSLGLHLNITIPYDSTKVGAVQTLTITATGTSIP